jgi:Protein of unknown function (DUF3618)
MIATEHEPMTRPLSNGTVYDGAGNTPSRIEADIAATRAELGEILGAIERKLEPRLLLEAGVDTLKSAIGSNTSRLGQSLRSQSLPLALIGLGIGWLLASQTTRPRRPQAAHGTDERASGLAGEECETVAPGGAGSTLNRSSGGPSGLTDQGPLVLGVLGFLAGVGVALVLPRSAAEERQIGPVGEWLREQAASLGREAVERAQHAAERTVDAAAEMLRNAIGDAGGG